MLVCHKGVIDRLDLHKVFDTLNKSITTDEIDQHKAFDTIYSRNPL